MLTGKNYEAIATIIARCSGTDVHYGYQTTYTDDLCTELANYFEQDNPGFDRDSFLVACGSRGRGKSKDDTPLNTAVADVVAAVADVVAAID